MQKLSRLLLACAVLLAGRSAVAQTVDGGHSHSVVATPDGRLFTWGYNASGQLGDGTTTQRNIPTEIAGMTGVVAVSGGHAHTLVLKDDGTVWAFGSNQYGQLGDGTLVSKTTPTQVSGLINVVAIAAGWSHSLAIETDGSVWVWGLNSSGQLCDGTTTDSNVPVYSGLSPAASVRGGGSHSIALRSDGTVVACGGNTYGQLGDGTATQRLSVVSVGGIVTGTGVDAGEFHSLVLLADGTVRAVGRNDKGQIGDGTYTERRTPVTVPSLTGVASIHAGAWFSLARKANGEVWVWGYNYDGQVGDGTTSNKTSPTRTPDIPEMAVVAAAGFHNIIVTADGTVRAWGWNARGQVGDRTTSGRTRPVIISGPSYAWLTAPPTFNPTPRTFTSPSTVTMSTSTPFAVIRFTTDGSTPTGDSPVYSGPVTINWTTTLNAATFRPGWQTSAPTTGLYSVTYPLLAPPTVTPDGGTYQSGLNVELATIDGGTIRYTLDGSTPGTTSTLYASPVAVDRSLTLKARAFHPNYTQSPVTTATYTVAVADPLLSLPSGDYPGGQQVAILEATPGATLRYTLHGGDPSESDPIIAAGGSLVLGNFTLKVRAFKNGCTPSQVVSATYHVTSGVTPPAVDAGSSHSVVLSTDGTVWSIGYNTQGQLGDGTNSTRRLPVRVSGLTGIKAVTASDAGSFALSSSGQVFAWGPSEGTLGDGTSTSRTRPVPVIGVSDAVAIATGSSHSLAIRADGTLAAWGKNASGALGDGTQTNRLSPVAVTGITSVVAVAAGEYGSTAVTADGTVWGWGANGAGQVGDGTTATRLAPVQVSGLTDVVAVAAGLRHRLALKSDGTVWAWGENSQGQLGDGTTTGRLVPATVPGLSGVTQIAAAGSHSFAVTADGHLWAWGYNASGQLGDGTTTRRLTPTLIAVLIDVVAAGGGGSHSLAVTSDGTVWTWGDNTYGELGDGTTTDQLAPHPISGAGMLWQVLTPTLGLASGTYFDEQAVTVTCLDPDAVLHYTTNGGTPTEADPVVASGGTVAIDRSLTLEVNGWKPGTLTSVVASATYQLQVRPPGITPSSGVYLAPPSVALTTQTPGSTARYTLDGTEPLAESAVYTEPLVVAHSFTAKARAFREGWTPSVTAVASYGLREGTLPAPGITPASAALTERPFVQVTDSDPDATIRYTLDGSDPGAASPVYRHGLLVPLGTTVKARAFRPGFDPSPVATATYSNANAEAAETPLLVPGGGFFPTTRTISIAAPADATLRYTTNGLDPTEADPLVPANRELLVDRALVLKVRAWRPNLQPSIPRRGDFVITGMVAAGDFHALALGASGDVWAWGSNQSGQLGDGTSTYRFSPIPIDGLTNVVAVAAGGQFSLALRTDGTVWAWGLNLAGQLGDGSNLVRSRPVLVSGLTDVVAIAAGDDHAMALKTDGTVWAWGHNGNGQLGDGTTVTRNTPGQVLALTGVGAISAGGDFSMALQTDGAGAGAVWAWGLNDRGQLGDGATAPRSVPVRLPGLPPVRAIAARLGWSAALSSTGAFWSWGANDHGQLGSGQERSAAAELVGIGPFSTFAAGRSFAVASEPRGTTWGWGSADNGQLGASLASCPDGDCRVPVRLPWPASVASAHGAAFSIVVLSDGTVWATGANASGQLGDGTSQPRSTLVPVSGLRLVNNDWLASDTDGDGLSNGIEATLGTDPLAWDTNGNGIADGIESGSADVMDSDADGLPDVVEVQRGSDPFVADTDGDGVQDAVDAFPLDPLRSLAGSPDPSDQTPPAILLSYPVNARRIR